MSLPYRVTACAAALTAALALGGCQSAGSGHAAGGAAAAPGASGAPGAPAPAAANGPRWVISMPDTVAGHSKIDPSAAQLKQITDTWAQTRAKVGANGQVQVGVYDDQAEDAYLIVTGVNGSGFDPSRVNTLSTAPAATRDADGNAVTNNFQNVDPGPHGGSDTCDEVMDEARSITVTLAAENTSCFWMTGTTFGGITFVNKQDGGIDFHSVDITAEVAGRIMVAVRSDIERQG